MRTFIYCPDCNEVFEKGDSTPKCNVPEHINKFNITGKQFTQWIIDKKPILKVFKDN